MGVSIISIMESMPSAKVSLIIFNGCWNVHPSTHTFAIELCDLILQKQITGRDDICWESIPYSKVSFSWIYDTVHDRGTAAPWTTLVWHQLAIPQCSFSFLAVY